MDIVIWAAKLRFVYISVKENLSSLYIMIYGRNSPEMSIKLASKCYSSIEIAKLILTATFIHSFHENYHSICTIAKAFCLNSIKPLQIVLSCWLCWPQTEAVAQRCSVKKVFLENSPNSQENTCARVAFLIKLQASCNFI